MTSIVITSQGLKFATGFNTVVIKIIAGEGTSSIVLDVVPNVEISLGDKTAAELGIEKGISVTVEPVADKTDGSFKLTVGKMPEKQAPTKTPVRGSSPSFGTSISNNLD